MRSFAALSVARRRRTFTKSRRRWNCVTSLCRASASRRQSVSWLPKQSVPPHVAVVGHAPCPSGRPRRSRPLPTSMRPRQLHGEREKQSAVSSEEEADGRSRRQKELFCLSCLLLLPSASCQPAPLKQLFIRLKRPTRARFRPCVGCL